MAKKKGFVLTGSVQAKDDVLTSSIRTTTPSSDKPK